MCKYFVVKIDCCTAQQFNAAFDNARNALLSEEEYFSKPCCLRRVVGRLHILCCPVCDLEYNVVRQKVDRILFEIFDSIPSPQALEIKFQQT